MDKIDRCRQIFVKKVGPLYFGWIRSYWSFSSGSYGGLRYFTVSFSRQKLYQKLEMYFSKMEVEGIL